MEEDLLLSAIEKYKNIIANKRLCVAVSGGIDSLTLTLILNKWCSTNNSELYAVTVDHGLRQKSREEAEYVSKLCESKNIKHCILTWKGEKPKNNIELLAREKRYSLIADYCKENDIDYLFVAHHIQDQVETFFIRLFRGSGIDGLSSMKTIAENYGLKIIRPFLDIQKETLKNYLIKNNIKWVEDESNSDEKYLRNKIRNFLDTFDDKENIIKRVNFAVNQIGDYKIFIDDYLKKIEKKILSFNSFGTCLFDKSKLLKEDENIILKILAKISMVISGNCYKPRLEKLKRLLDNLQNNDIIKYTFYGCIFETYSDSKIMVYREYNAINTDVDLIYNREIIWDNRFKIILKENRNDLKIGCVKMGDFNKILLSIRESNRDKYKEMKHISGIEKSIFYTLPVVKNSKNEYIMDFEKIDIEFIINNNY